jgi:hypothetical protein
MKRITILTILLITTVVLSACAAQETTPVANNIPLADGTPAPGQNPLSEQEQLIVGSFNLEGTGNAIAAEQAQELLPLWQTMKALSTSDTVATQEIEALLKQIQETMTTEQTQAITSMGLTRTAMFTFMQEQGIEPSLARRGGQGADSNSEGGFQPPEGFVPGQGGGPGGGQGGGPGGGADIQNLSPEQQATVQARMAERAANGDSFTQRVDPAVYDAIIDLLKSKNE